MLNPSSMWRSWLFVGSLVCASAVVALRAGVPPKVHQALLSSGQLFLAVLPNLVLGFLLAGFLNVLVPAEVISHAMGRESGGRGLLIGTVAGSLTPGGPFTHFPILASFLAKGAAVGPVCAYIAAWALLGVNRIIVWELPILGPRIALVRVLASAAVPPLVGWLAAWLFRLFRCSA